MPADGDGVNGWGTPCADLAEDGANSEKRLGLTLMLREWYGWEMAYLALRWLRPWRGDCADVNACGGLRILRW